MSKRKRTEVTIRTREVIVVHPGKPERSRARCPVCRKPLLMLSVDGAAQVAGVSARTVYRWAEEDKVHYLETPAGQLLICAESLRARC